MTPQTIREKMIQVVSRNGGHLASSLGTVELAIALNESFDSKVDRVVWDVGHQAYAWKILTGRADDFGSLRMFGGMSGFPNPKESPSDAAISGHAGSALSVAAGLAAARDRLGEKHHVVAVVGDASIVNGMSFEALNNVAGATKRLIVILNDNEMAISRPTGAFSRVLGRMISSVRYNRVKAAAKKAGKALRLGFMYGLVHGIKTSLKRFFLGDLFFEQFGFAYKGPVDGHNPAALSSALAVAKESSVPVLIHVVTKKGFGFRPAEAHPTQWHGVGAFDIAKSENSLYPEKPGGGAREAVDYSAAFGKVLMKLAEADDRVIALTAAMTDGTGLKNFSKTFPSRFFDVGIAEEHLMGFAAGLAAAGLKPVVAIYSTFLQRSVDQVIHDIAIMNLPVVICVDRAGVVGKDGVTHQGLFDIALLRAIPNLTILQPKDYEDLSKMLSEAIASDGPVVIRYPRGMGPVYQEVYENKDALLQIWAAGDQIEKANAVARELGGGVVYARSIKPIDSELLASQRDRGCKIVSLENASVIGGLGDAISADVKIGYPDEFIEHGTVEELEKKYSMDVESVIERLRKNG